MLHETLGNFAGSKGINCAEGTLLAADAYYHLELDPQAFHLLSGFGGGAGCGSFCGALAGALAALSYIELRDQKLAYNHQSPTLRPDCALLVERFRAKYGSELCEKIKPQVENVPGKCETVRAAACDLLEELLLQFAAGDAR